MTATLSPYVAGAGVGLLSWFAFATVEKPIGVTTPFEATAAALAQRVAPRAMRVNSYLAERDEVPKLGWEWMLVAGIGLGSYLSGGRVDVARRRTVPTLWRRRFGGSNKRRFAGAFFGGLAMMFGARMAGGCTSGHAISGTMQLAASSLLFTTVMSATAVGVARALFGGTR